MTKTPDQYRKFAEECQRWAREAKTESQKNILQQMADVWKMLSDDAAKKARALVRTGAAGVRRRFNGS